MKISFSFQRFSLQSFNITNPNKITKKYQALSNHTCNLSFLKKDSQRKTKEIFKNKKNANFLLFFSDFSDFTNNVVICT